MGGVWSRSLESLLCELWGNFGGILEHGSIHLSARAVAERYFFGKFLPEVPPKSGSGRVGRTKTVPDFRDAPLHKIWEPTRPSPNFGRHFSKPNFKFYATRSASAVWAFCHLIPEVRENFPRNLEAAPPLWPSESKRFSSLPVQFRYGSVGRALARGCRFDSCPQQVPSTKGKRSPKKNIWL